MPKESQPGRPWQVRQTTLEIDLGLLKQNCRKLRARARRSDLMVLLKSNAYGHSISEVALALDSLSERDGPVGYGVANVEEGIELRRDGVKKPIYVMSGIQHYDEALDRCLETCELTPVIASLAVLKDAARTLKKSGASRRVHLKFNTGMNRLGIEPSEVSAVIRLLQSAREIVVEGILSHLALGENPKHALTRAQAKCFRQVAGALSEAGIQPRYLHLENSSGLANHVLPEGTMARVGLHLYGVGDDELKPAARWIAQIYQTRELKRGDSVGYGARFKAKKNMRMAVLGVGYGDGYHRSFSNRSEVLVRGRRCPVIGSVSMDLTVIDISGVPKATVNDHAVLLGRDGRDEITAAELAVHANTISYEVLTSISPRVPRVFKG